MELRGVWHQGFKVDSKKHGTPAIGGQGSAIRKPQIAGVYPLVYPKST